MQSSGRGRGLRSGAHRAGWLAAWLNVVRHTGDGDFFPPTGVLLVGYSVFSPFSLQPGNLTILRVFNQNAEGQFLLLPGIERGSPGDPAVGP